jgi:hypothetical protein
MWEENHASMVPPARATKVARTSLTASPIEDPSLLCGFPRRRPWLPP